MSPDPIFRKGLEHYSKAAPASVWDRVEAGLERKRRKSVWLKVAAGLFLLIGTTTVFWQSNDTDNVVAAVPKESAIITLNADTIDSVVQEETKSSLRESSVVSREEVVHTRQLAANRRQSLVSNRKLEVTCKQSEVGSQKSVTTSEEANLITITEPEEINSEPTPIHSIGGSVNNVIVEQKRTSITYSSEEVNEKFLKKELTAEATPSRKNTSGLQKVIDKALELTNDGTVYSEIREKKNEWLSLNILSNKSESNK